jgi:hypothetical protein
MAGMKVGLKVAQLLTSSLTSVPVNLASVRSRSFEKDVRIALIIFYEVT